MPSAKPAISPKRISDRRAADRKGPAADLAVGRLPKNERGGMPAWACRCPLKNGAEQVMQSNAMAPL
ncbi:hypothetical protein LCM4573_10730 [Rhizobium sp. LCM 4573]|nr:hypothetical protein LCM4573_10730 [Rhizobium sp. LCM 4573]